MTLYCVGLSKPVSSGNIWYKDGTQLTTGHKAFDWSTFGPMDDVLVLKNITMETGGVYRCVNAEGASLTSSLTVLCKLDCSNYRIFSEIIQAGPIQYV